MSSTRSSATLTAERTKQQRVSFVKELPAPVWLGVLEAVTILGLSAFLRLEPPVSWLFLLSLVAAVTVGSDRLWLEASTPQPKLLPLRLPWLLPGLSLTSSALFLRQMTGGLLLIPGLLVAGLLLILVLLGESRAHWPVVHHAFVGKLLLSLSNFVIAFSFFVALRALFPELPFTALATGATSGVLAFQFLREEGVPLTRRGIYAGVLGLIFGEIAWGLRYWPLRSVEAGLVLLLLYYPAVGMAQSHVVQKLTRKVAVEFATVSLLGLLFILGSHLWLR